MERFNQPAMIGTIFTRRCLTYRSHPLGGLPDDARLPQLLCDDYVLNHLLSLFMYRGVMSFCTLAPTTGRDQPSVGARVRLRYVPSTSYRFLQTSPLAGDALANRILFPMNRARSLTSSDGVCQLRWANKKPALTEANAGRCCLRKVLTKREA